MVVVLDELLEQDLEMPLVNDDDMIEKLSPESANESPDSAIAIMKVTA